MNPLPVSLLTTFPASMVGVYLDAIAECRLEDRLLIGDSPMAIKANSYGLYDSSVDDLTTFWFIHRHLAFDRVLTMARRGENLNDSDSYGLHKAETTVRDLMLSLKLPDTANWRIPAP